MENKIPDLVKIKATKTLSNMYGHEKFKQEEVLKQELCSTRFVIQNAIGSKDIGVCVTNGLKVKLMFDRVDYDCSNCQEITPASALKLLEWLKKYEQFLKDIQEIK